MATGSYRIQFNANGGSGAPATITGTTTWDDDDSRYYAYPKLPSTKPSRSYFTFLGWSGSSSATSASYSPGGTYAISTTSALFVTTLYAVWRHNTVTVSYNANGGTGAPSAQTVNQYEWFNLRTGVPTRSGYSFLGWATSSDATAAAYQPGGQARFTSNVTLYAVWKVSNSTISSISGSVPIDGSTQGSVSISSINSSYTHKLTISIGESSQVINMAAGVTSATFTIPTSWLSEVPNSTTGTAVASLKTYSGSTQIGGADAKTFSITVPSSVVPTLSVSTTNINSNSVVDGWGILLQNYSQIKLTATAAGGTGASVANIAYSGDGLSTTGTATSATSAVLTASGSRSWTVTVTDSRGRTKSATVTRTVHEYFSPSIETLTAFRADSSGNRDDAAGTYIKARGVFSYASADGNNSLSVRKIEYQAENVSTWTVGQNNVVSGTSYLFGGGNITETKLFHVRLSLTDALGNSAQYVVDVSPIVGYGFGLKNDRVHFGGPCKEPGFVCDFDAKFEGVVDVVPRRAFATLSSEGWYRVCTYDGTNSSNALGGHGAVVKFDIQKHTSAENHSITLRMASSSNIIFCDESSHSTTQLIDKIRYNVNGQYGYVDIHFTGTASRGVGVDFSVNESTQAYLANWTSNNLSAVADAPAEETVITTYTFMSETTAPKVQCGLTSALSVSTGSYADLDVTFPQAFATQPIVTVSILTGSVGVGMGNLSCAIKSNSISTTGFTIRCFNNDTSTRSPNFTWIAISN